MLTLPLYNLCVFERAEMQFFKLFVISRSPVCEEIICCRGDHVRLAVRVRVFTYPESACAVWIMFAVRYRSIL